MTGPEAALARRNDWHAALRIAVVYLLFATLWILLSDRVVEQVIPADRLQHIYGFQTAKGLFFVATTAVLLLILVMRRQRQIRVAETEAAETKQRLATLTSNFPGVAYIRDRQFRFIMLSGQLPPGSPSADDRIGATGEGDMSPDSFTRLTTRDAEVMDTGKPSQTLETVEIAGRTFHFLVHRFALSSPSGEPWVAGLAINITERQEAETRIRVMAKELEQANRMKDQFLTNLSHELRTPVTAIRLWSEVLRNPSPDDMETIREAVAMIQHSAVMQTLLIEDLLDVTRIIGGRLKIEIKPIRLSEIVRKTVDLLLPLADEKHVRLETEIGGVGPSMMLGDAGRVQQVIWNLLTNAIKFSDDRGVVTCALDSDGDEWVLTVTDHGRGISPDKLSQVFDRFRQIASAREKNESGIGIGLSIVKHLAEAHGGSVSAYSQGEGHGAKFTVRFPMAHQAAMQLDALPQQPLAAPAIPVPNEQKLDLSGQRILLVEDNTDSRTALALLLSRIGAAVTSVDSAEAALAASGPFDLLLSDIGLPDRDGCELMRELRKRPDWTDKPTIAISAYAQPEDKARAADAGFKDFITKPVDPEELMKLLSNRATAGV